MLDMVLGVGDIAVKKTDESLNPWHSYSSGKDTQEAVGQTHLC